MANYRFTPTALLVFLEVMTASTMRAQVPPARHQIVQDVKTGLVLVDTSQRWALDELARQNKVVVLYCQFFSWGRAMPRPATMEVPSGIEGMKQLAQGAGYTMRELSPQAVLAGTSGCGDDEAVLITAQRVLGIGGTIDANIQLEDLEWELLRSASDSVRDNVHGNLFGSPWIATYYWPTREGRGHEFYVQQQSSTGLTVNYPPQRYLRKVSVASNRGTLEVKDLWMDERGTEPQARLIDGPVAELELDFDGDGVVDVVCLSGVRGRDFAVPPLHVLSGKTGREIGQIEGFEIVVAEDARGRLLFKTLARDGYRTYGLDAERMLTLQHFEQTDADSAEPLLLQAPGSSTGQATVLGLKANEKVIDDFLVRPPTSSNPNAFRRLKVLKAIGESMIFPPGGSHGLKDTHVLLDYQPKAGGGDKSAPR